jgi:hypothetical protein
VCIPYHRSFYHRAVDLSSPPATEVNAHCPSLDNYQPWASTLLSLISSASAPWSAVACLGPTHTTPQFSALRALTASSWCFPAPAQPARLVILFLSPVGSLHCMWEPMGTSSSFCPTGEPMGTYCPPFPSCFLHNPKFLIFNWSVYCLLSRWFLFGLISRHWKWRRYVPPKRPLTFNRLHAVISQKTELLVTTAVNPARCGMLML